MKKLTLLVSLLFAQLTVSQTAVDNDTLEIWTVFSTGNFVRQHAERIVAQKWPFSIKGVAGDVVSDELMDTVTLHNQRIWKYLDLNGYVDSKNQFEMDMGQEVQRIQKAVDIADAHPKVKKLLDKWRKSGRQPYTELKKLSLVSYEFFLYSFDLNHLEEEQKLELQYRVNYDTEEIIFTE
ncbi:hypothetical protein [Aquimarina brevivitae]|uniref:Uncharacterized protein n=1 Tax=Aquimarina brevivitae TaxID=323412 RepID=A0A4Q7NTQ0_9FLAO|nr:hypothetical protein [Aquimarina brevivitae]RZS90563.1 hypothetical protein EV197_3357 [Aquimarina brevivitae]